ncbi:hypothetical protein CP533_4806 [Ophiocordyceps camponoti-saundersi (nom. inval.)]|nr:hypothetical protein CP533_4806 [Ophiocordyceps camponoti-saundersi (nom. inval.)]
MSRSGGRGRDASRRFQPLPSRPQFLADNTPSRTVAAVPGQGNPHNVPRNPIPGLGLGFSSGSPAQQGSPATQPCAWNAAPQPPAQISTKKSTAADGAGGEKDSVSEEGEISEGSDDEHLDKDHPSGNHLVATDSRKGAFGSAQQDSNSFASRGRRTFIQTPSQAVASQPGSANAARQRSGSYSPYLSPREMNNSHSSPGAQNRDSLGALAPASDFAGQVRANDGVVSSPTQADFQLAKQKAKDAVLQLWSHNIRYQDYLNQGIDAAVIGGLFKELDLEFSETANTLQQDKAPDIGVGGAPVSRKGPEVNSAKAQLPSLEPTIEGASKAVDQSEERKDRIARLLALKGSKATVPPSNPPHPSEVPAPASTKVTPITQKAQSEKLKLLHQKMEALRKSREKLVPPPGRQSEGANTANLEAEKTPAQDVTATMIADEESRGFLERLSEAEMPPRPDKLPSSFSGLFPSMTRQPSQSPDSNRPPSSPDRPASAFSRPFGQTASRPLLINVSDDDDDDAEMDIDSPVGSSREPFVTPSQKMVAIREHASAASNAVSRQGQTPTSAATPPRSLSHGGGEDLASMNKRIEAMKRKIAEAEARKRIKLSGQASPAVSQQNDGSRAASVEMGSVPSDLTAPVVSSPERNGTPVAANLTAEPPHERPPHTADPGPDRITGRQRRSITASERLPFIEAHRKEQLLKLKNLQSEMARVEQEIAQSMHEEEKLKRDLAASNSDELQEGTLAGEYSKLDQLSRTIVTCIRWAYRVAQSLSDRKAEAGTSGSAQHNGDNTVFSGGETDRDTEMVSEMPGLDAAETARGDLTPRKEDNAAPLSMTTEVPDTTEECMVGAAHESNQESESDVIMDGLDIGTGEDSGDSTDNYEPPDAESGGKDMLTSPAEEAPRDDVSAAIEATENGSTTTKEIASHSVSAASAASDGRFVPYETPLQCFRAYRFHPEFGKRVEGGLRSLTYSNKIDVQKQLCPDELAGQPCPRGSQCDYQHFESMRAPDDQILLQLGAAGHYQESQRQQYIAGLRELLTDLRNRKVKDFNTISQGIIDYRARFLGDASKILPLSGVSI